MRSWAKQFGGLRDFARVRVQVGNLHCVPSGVAAQGLAARGGELGPFVRVSGSGGRRAVLRVGNVYGVTEYRQTK